MTLSTRVVALNRGSYAPTKSHSDELAPPTNAVALRRKAPPQLFVRDAGVTGIRRMPPPTKYRLTIADTTGKHQRGNGRRSTSRRSNSRRSCHDGRSTYSTANRRLRTENAKPAVLKRAPRQRNHHDRPVHFFFFLPKWSVRAALWRPILETPHRLLGSLSRANLHKRQQQRPLQQEARGLNELVRAAARSGARHRLKLRLLTNTFHSPRPPFPLFQFFFFFR